MYYVGETLWDEIRRRRSDEQFLLAILVIMGLFAALFSGVSLGYSEAEKRLQQRETEIVAQKDAEIAAKDAEIAEKEAEIAAREAEIRKIQARKVILDENGVRTDRMREVYLTSDPYRESEIQTDAEFREYCRENYPEAVLPTEEWTAESVVASWLENPEIWGTWTDDYNDLKTYFVWSADFEHCFYLDLTEPIIPVVYETGEHRELISGWLVMDGVRILMLDQQTYDIDDPYMMLRQYQSGEWDGSSRRSHDGATTVEVDWMDGGLEYRYEAWRYDQTTDPLELAYTGYAEEPWWHRAGLSEDLLKAVGERNRYQVWDDAGTRGSALLWTWDFYVDLPGGISANVEGLGEIYDKMRIGQETFFATSTGVWLYARGELVDHWACKPDEKTADLFTRCALPKTPEEIAQLDAVAPEVKDDSGELIPTKSEQQKAQEYAENYEACQALGLVSLADRGYIYTGTDLLVLRENGEVEPFFDQILIGPGYFSPEMWGLKDRRLVYWRGYSFSSGSGLPKVVAEDVLEADFTDLMLFTKADGCYGVVRSYSDQREVLYLGTEAMDYYNEFYDTLWSIRQ